MKLRVLRLVNENIRKDPDDARQNIFGDIQLSSDVVRALNGIVKLHIQKKLGDQDDARKQTLIQNIKDDLLDIHNALNPS
jgi:hypothetical protein